MLPADSSQLKAILLASSGNSFVLQGPPGTGKSQTITNIIAQLIANGKSILFVSAKMAALDVVYKKLKDVKLNDFCLKLKDVKLNDFCLKLNISSSNGEGISKKDALKQLENTWSKGKNMNNFSFNELDWDRHNNEIDKIKILLNEYKDELHYEHQNGLKLYDAIGYLSNNNDAQDIKNLEFDFESHTKEYRDELEAIVQKIQECVSDYSEIIQSNELKQINIENKKYNHAFQNKLEDDIDDAKNIVGKLENDFYDLISFFNLNSIYQNISNDGIEKLIIFFEHFYNRPKFLNPFLNNKEDIFETLKKLINLKKNLIEKKNYLNNLAQKEQEKEKNLSLVYIKSAEKLEEKTLSSMLKKTNSQNKIIPWFIKRFFNKRKIKIILRENSLDAKRKINVESELKQISKIKSERQKAQEEIKFEKKLIDDIEYGISEQNDIIEGVNIILQNNSDIQISEIEIIIKWIEDFDVKFSSLQNFEKNKITNLILESDFIKDFDYEKLQDKIFSIKKSKENLKQNIENLYQEYFVNKIFLENYSLEDIKNNIELLNRNQDKIQSYFYWNEIRNQSIHQYKLEVLISEIENNKIDLNKIFEIFQCRYYKKWLEVISPNTKILSLFDKKIHERNIENFRKKDDEKFSLSSENIRNSIISKIQNNSNYDSYLRKEFGKNRHQSLRMIFKRLSDYLTTLTPCILLNPLSVTSYFDIKDRIFDVVIFDEASQIETCEAIGIIARCKQMIVVSDSQQLPPTNFFKNNCDEDDKCDVNEEESDKKENLENLESLLHECSGSNLQSLSLKWHYRSQDESLIAFSNKHFYDNKLITFPSNHHNNDNEKIGIDYRYVDGIYSNNINKIEAEEIVKEIKEIIKSSKNQLSIGVVTFNKKQQEYISDLIDKEIELDRNFENYLNSKESFFIKNIENVQGDERDIIILSSVYGKNENGKVSQNFGPLNKDGGDKRLNVAITRARVSLKIFTSLKSNNISSEKLTYFKNYLEYIETGKITNEYDSVKNKYDSLFEESVIDALRKKGWDVESQIGVSGFKIDIGVKHPNFLGKFLAGIECDGYTYHSSKSARDRDKLRQRILEKLGWKILSNMVYRLVA